MNTISKILILIGGVYAVAYYRAYRAVRSLVFDYKKLTIEKLSKDDAKIGIWINAQNASSQKIIVNKINLRVYVNNSYIGTLENPTTQVIQAHGTQTLFFILPISYNSVLTQLAEMLANYDSSKIRVYVEGSILFQGVAVPLPKIEIYEEDFRQIMENDVLKVLVDFSNKLPFKIGEVEPYKTNVL